MRVDGSDSALYVTMEGEGVLNWDRKRNAFDTTSNGFASGRSCDNKLSREKC